MSKKNCIHLKPRTTPNCLVEQTGEASWKLGIPAGPAKEYRLAQIDDYATLKRRSLPWRAPVKFHLRARASAQDIPGTWGFGFWNDPFSLGLVKGVEFLRLPSLPNTAWFFMASEPNYLSLRDDLPANGHLAATFRSPRIPSLLLSLGAPLLVGMLIPSSRHWMRRQARRFVKQGAARLSLDLADWHTYEIDWRKKGVSFFVDEKPVLEGAPSPKGPLGLVLWIDNQYAAFGPDAQFRAGSLAYKNEAWIEVQEMRCDRA